MLKFLAPLMTSLTTVGKSRELLAVLDIQPLPKQANVVGQTWPKLEADEGRLYDRQILFYSAVFQ